MNIGYACIALCVNNTNLNSCMLKNADENNLKKIIANNLQSLNNIIEYNNKNNIRLFRISSCIIPFGSNPVNKLEWDKIFAEELFDIGNKIKKYNIRVSMHPGQYTVLNPDNDNVFKRAVEDLIYHAKFLNCLKTDEKNKIILHIGGRYNDKQESIRRFINNYNLLSDEIKKRLVIENDGNCYNINDVINIGCALNIPVIYDVFHNKINPYDIQKNDLYYIKECKKLWHSYDGNIKIHYSQQGSGRKGTHSQNIETTEFIDFYKSLEGFDTDIMLEVKDKNISAIKCINCIDNNKDILLKDIKRYEFCMMEKSFEYYNYFKKLTHKNDIDAIKIYKQIETALKINILPENFLTAANAVFDCLKNEADEYEKNKYNLYIKKYSDKKSSAPRIKNYLYNLAVKYDNEDIYDSYYFNY